MKKNILSVLCFVMIAVLLTAQVSATVTISGVSALPDPAEYGIVDIMFNADISSDNPPLTDVSFIVNGIDRSSYLTSSGDTYSATLSSSLFDIGDIDYVFSGTDGDGTVSSSSSVEIQDETAPVINDYLIPTTVCYGDHISVFASVTDNYDDPVDYVAVNIVGIDYPGIDYPLSELADNYFTDADAIDSTIFGGVTTLASYIYAEDSNGNDENTAPQFISIYDCVAPTISGVSDAPDPVEYGLPITISADITDDISLIDADNVIVTIGINEDKMENIGGDTYSVDIDTTGFALETTYTYTITANDDSEAENEATATGTFEVEDTTKPIIILSGSSIVTVEVGSPYEDEGAIALDNYDPSVTVIPSGSVDTATIGTYTLYYDATDSSDNAAAQVIRIVNVVDTTPPLIELLGNNPETVEVGSTYTDAGATALDNYDGDLTESIDTVNPVETTTIRIYPVTYDVTDLSGNAAAQVVRVVYVVDTTAPVIELLGSSIVTVEVGSLYEDEGATATDNYDASVTVIPSGSVDTATIGTYTLYYDATDQLGNPAEQVFRIVNVVDTTPPVVGTPSAIPNPAEAGASVVFSAPVTDYVEVGFVVLTIDSNSYIMTYDSGTGEYTYTLDTTVLSDVGSFTYTIDAVDTSFNYGENSGTLEVVDAKAPVIDVLGDNPETVEAGLTYTDAGATAEDAVDGTVAVTASGSVDTMTVDTYTITYTASDSAGNTATATRTVSVVDTTAPVITILGDNTETVEVGSIYTDAGATAEDTVDGDLTSLITATGSVDTSVEGTYIITYTVTDSEGNTATAIRTVEVVDSINPALGTVTLSQSPVEQDTPVVFSVDAADSNGIDSVAITIAGVVTDEPMTNTAGDTYEYTVDTTGLALGTYSYTITATDSYGNTATRSGTFLITIVSPITVEIRADKTSGEEDLDVSFTAAVSGGVDQLDYSWNFGDGNTDANMYNRHTFTSDGTFTVTLTVEDNYGNVGTDSVTITVGEKKVSKNSRNNVRLTGISFDTDSVSAGESLIAEVSIENIGNDDLEDVSLALFIEELGIWAQTTGIDVDDRDTKEKTVALDIPDDVEPGYYDVRIVVSNDEMKRVVYRDIKIS